MTTTNTETAAVDADLDLEWLSLDDNEEILWAGGPDRRTLVPAFVIGIPLTLVLIGLLIIVGEYLRVTNTHYVVTTRALYKKTGVFSRDVKRIEHGKVQDISYSQSALGTHFGYGSVEISTAGGSGVEMSFDSVPDPRAIQQRIGERIKRERGESADDRTKDEILEEILTELRAIRTAVEGGATGRSNAETSTANGRPDDQSYEYDEDRSL
ncbi:PH domain-containing protein [Natrinema longum]|uniref:PH domain-containing protein n=1 Tax=Natrinema longum TaxID=370324 RepID=A0A8A2U8S9_9EURY|nr:PH domain-containing protein [Natrinema longum]MBZ6493643.1 PH domain-containing protein [Natrinema longum]QSW85016.1 PH domain-containing protein [Natrinema longum]